MRQNPDRQAKAMTASESFLVDELAQRVRTSAIQPSSAALDEIVEQEIGQVEETLLSSSPALREHGSLRSSLDSTLYAHPACSSASRTAYVTFVPRRGSN